MYLLLTWEFTGGSCFVVWHAPAVTWEFSIRVLSIPPPLHPPSPPSPSTLPPIHPENSQSQVAAANVTGKKRAPSGSFPAAVGGAQVAGKGATGQAGGPHGKGGVGHGRNNVLDPHDSRISTTARDKGLLLGRHIGRLAKGKPQAQRWVGCSMLYFCRWGCDDYDVGINTVWFSS